MIKRIIKRDGRTVTFEPQKITNAILAAMKKCNVRAIKLAESITADICNKSSDTVEVEQIQDMIEIALMKSKYTNVAKEFITYRNERTKIRRKSSSLNKKIENILLCKNVQNSNANVDEYSFAGRKNESANALHKDIALNAFIRPEIAEAHNNNEIYEHDLSEYNIGSPNCLFANVSKLLAEGFMTRNGGVRPANRFSTACQLIAVIFQIVSQGQFGGIASLHIDTDLAPYVKKSFIKHYKLGLRWAEFDESKNWNEFINTIAARHKNNKEYAESLIKAAHINDVLFKNYSPRAFEYATEMLEEEGLQAAQAAYHNLNTLESRPGSQLPFTSINFGRDTTPEGRKVTEWLLKASIAGIGTHNETPIFPISIFQYKKGINDKPGTPNYDLKLLAIESLSKRVYPK